ncbi:MAG TPA: Ku protein [Candidatus Thermoplasmatota archaeon]|nr:Ku protein [Candidatus Thermoplasmatota archaeon]
MPRSIWSGAVSFGLVNVPVKAYSAASPKDVRFHQLHGPDGARIQQKRWCSAEDREVPYEEIVKGYEISPDRYVTVTREELDALDPEATKTIDIESFVELSEIDPMHFENAYWLAPDKGAAKPYALLVRALEEAGRVGLARVVMRTKKYLVALRAKDGAMAMFTMAYPDEITPAPEIEGLPAVTKDVSEREIALARQLVEALSEPFDPSKLVDDYRARVLDLVEKKAAGEEIVVAPAPEAAAAPKNLMAALEASIAAAKKAEA